METMSEMVNGDGDCASKQTIQAEKHLASDNGADDSKDVASIIGDIDKFMNGDLSNKSTSVPNATTQSKSCNTASAEVVKCPDTNTYTPAVEGESESAPPPSSEASTSSPSSASTSSTTCTPSPSGLTLPAVTSDTANFSTEYQGNKGSENESVLHSKACDGSSPQCSTGSSFSSIPVEQCDLQSTNTSDGGYSAKVNNLEEVVKVNESDDRTAVDTEDTPSLATKTAVGAAAQVLPHDSSSSSKVTQDSPGVGHNSSSAVDLELTSVEVQKRTNCENQDKSKISPQSMAGTKTCDGADIQTDSNSDKSVTVNSDIDTKAKIGSDAQKENYTSTETNGLLENVPDSANVPATDLGSSRSSSETTNVHTDSEHEINSPPAASVHGRPEAENCLAVQPSDKSCEDPSSPDCEMVDVSLQHSDPVKGNDNNGPVVNSGECPSKSADQPSESCEAPSSSDCEMADDSLRHNYSNGVCMNDSFMISEDGPSESTVQSSDKSCEGPSSSNCEMRNDSSRHFDHGKGDSVVNTGDNLSKSIGSSVLDKSPAVELKMANCTGETKGACKEVLDSPSDPNTADTSLCTIQILESSSIAENGLFTKEDSMRQEEECEGLDAPTAPMESALVDTDVSFQQLNENQNNNSVAETSNSTESLPKNADPFVSSNNTVANLQENIGSNKINGKTDCESSSQDTHGIADHKEETSMLSETGSNAVQVVEEDESKPAETVAKKITFKDILKVPLTTNNEGSDKCQSLQSDGKAMSLEETDRGKVESLTPGESKSSLSVSKPESGHENSKKRSLVCHDDSGLTSKRTKLEEAVAEDPQESNVLEVLDSDEDVILSESVEDEKSTGKNDDAKDLKLSDAKDDKPTLEIKDDASASISLTSQVLQAFITARFKAFIKKQKQLQIEKVNKRISMMQSSTSLWKETTKHLERSVKEVTVINQGVEKHRAHLNAQKKPNRSVGTQVNDEKVKSAHTMVLNFNIPQIRPPMTNKALGQPGGPNTQAPQQARHRPQQQVSPAAARAQASHQSTPQRQARPPVQTQGPTPPQSSVVNLIDLTDDDESAKTAPPSATQSMPGGRSINTSGVRTGHTNGFVPLGPMSSGKQAVPPQAQAANRPNSKTSPYASQSGRPVNMVMNNRPPTGPAVASTPLRQRPDPPGNKAVTKSVTMHTLPQSMLPQPKRHPAPLPQVQDPGLSNIRALKLPPKPTLKISRVSQGIVLSWNMPPLIGVEVITSYQLFAYQETDTAPRTNLWKKVGDVRALPLPMACTLTQFQEGNKYHFAVRAVDQFSRTGTFSDPSSIFLGSTSSKAP